MKSYFSQKNIPAALLAVVLVKAFVFPFAAFDAMALTALSVLFGFKLWIDHKESQADEELQEVVEANRKYLEDKIIELDAVYTDAINKIDAKVSSQMFANSQRVGGAFAGFGGKTNVKG